MKTQGNLTKVLLMAAGLGTRLRPLTDETPKCLIPIARRPLLDYWLDRLMPTPARNVLVNTHHLREQVRRYIDAANRRGFGSDRFQIDEAFEPTLLGSAGTVHANRAFADDADTILIIYADNLSGIDLSSLLAFHDSHPDPLTMVLFRTDFPERCGIAEVDESMRVLHFVEKPARPRGNLANAGLYAVAADAFREMAEMAAFDLAFDVLPKFVGRMRGWEWQGYHLDIGTHESLAQAEADVAQGCLAPEFRRTSRWKAPE
jgi:mannose-1-phosphate guanylyltransferase